jgi:menaquinone-specific isochorismate synthase
MEKREQNSLNNWAFLQVGADRFWVWQGAWEAHSKPIQSEANLWLSDFFLKNRLPWQSLASGSSPRLLSRSEFLGFWNSLISDAEKKETLPELQWEAPRDSFFQTHFDTLQEWIEAGVLKKGVPVASCRAFFRADSLACENSRNRWLIETLQRLDNVPSHLFLYGFCSEGQGFIGATPEILFEVSAERELRTMALAGTRRVGAGSEDGSAALGSTPKDQAEHFAVVEDIEQRLLRVSEDGKVTRGVTEVRRFGILEHLHTPLAAKISERVGYEQLLLLLHPTAALGVHPRVKTGHRWLDKMDAFDRRESFGAPFGAVFPDGSSCALVAIRQIQFDARGIKLWAGAGVVAESELEKEWAEILLKMESICRTFGLQPPRWEAS